MLSRHAEYYDVRINYKESQSLQKAGHRVVTVHRPLHNVKIRHPLTDAFGMARETVKARPDAIHCHDIETLASGLLAKRKLNVPVILDAHEDYPKLVASWNKPLARTWKLFESIAIPLVDKVITVNNILGQHYKDPIIVRNYPPLWFAEIEGDDMRDIISPNGETAILYHGVLGEARGPDVMFKVAKKLTKKYDCKFFFLGQKFGDISVPDGNNIKHLGKFHWLDVPNYLRVADIGFCAMNPTEKYRQGLPTKLLECMAFGIPFVANEEFPLVMKLLEDVFCGAPCKYEVKHLVKSLSTLIEDEELRKLLGDRGKKAIREKYNWESEVKKLVRLYDELEKV